MLGARRTRAWTRRRSRSTSALTVVDRGPSPVGYHRRGVRVSYLLGDSSEANIDFDYLAFLREVIDCATVLVEC